MTEDPSPPLNREQRRRQKFRRPPSARQDNLHTERENSTGFLTAPAAGAADGSAVDQDAGAPDQDARAAADVSADATAPGGAATADAAVDTAAVTTDAAEPEVQPGG